MIFTDAQASVGRYLQDVRLIVVVVQHPIQALLPQIELCQRKDEYYLFYKDNAVS